MQKKKNEHTADFSDRYVLSNSKDQTMKLWDLRLMSDPSETEKLTKAMKTHTSLFCFVCFFVFFLGGFVWL